MVDFAYKSLICVWFAPEQQSGSIIVSNSLMNDFDVCN